MKLPIYTDQSKVESTYGARRQQGAGVDLPASGASVRSAGEPGQALSDFGKTLQKVGEEWEAIEKKIEASRQTVRATEFSLGLTSEAQAILDKPDISIPPAELAETFHRDQTAKMQAHIETIPDEVQRNQIQASLMPQIAANTIKIRAAANATALTAVRAADAAIREQTLRDIENAADGLTVLQKEEAYKAALSLHTENQVYSPVEAQDIWSKFERGRDRGLAAKAMEQNPRAFGINVLDPRHYPTLTAGERQTLGHQARKLADDQDRDERQAIHDFNVAYTGWLVASLSDGDLTPQQAVALAQQHPGMNVSHVLEVGERIEARSTRASDQASREAYHGFLKDIPLGTDADRQEVLRQAELANGEGTLNNKDLGELRIHYRTWSAQDVERLSRAEARAATAEQREEIAERRKRAEKERSLRLEYQSAEKEIPALLGVDTHGPAGFAFRDIMEKVTGSLRSQMLAVVNVETAEATGKGPRQVLMDLLPLALQNVHGSTEAALKATVPRLMHSSPEFLRQNAGRLNPAQFREQAILWKQVEVLSGWMELQRGMPGTKTQPPTPQSPTQQRHEWVPPPWLQQIKGAKPSPEGEAPSVTP